MAKKIGDLSAEKGVEVDPSHWRTPITLQVELRHDDAIGCSGEEGVHVGDVLLKSYGSCKHTVAQQLHKLADLIENSEGLMGSAQIFVLGRRA